MFRKKRKVLMLVSVGGDLVAGRTYKVIAEQADELIVKEYAEGELSRPFSDEERAVMRSNMQVVNFGG